MPTYFDDQMAFLDGEKKKAQQAVTNGLNSIKILEGAQLQLTEMKNALDAADAIEAFCKQVCPCPVSTTA